MLYINLVINEREDYTNNINQFSNLLINVTYLKSKADEVIAIKYIYRIIFVSIFTKFKQKKDYKVEDTSNK